MNKVFGSLWNYTRSTDLWLALMAFACSILSVLLLLGIWENEWIYFAVVRTQLIATGMGVLFAVILSKIDYRFIAKMWKLHAPFAILLVGLTFTSLGKQRMDEVDDRAWLTIFGFGLQPSELLKISFIMTFAYHLYKVRDNINSGKNMLLLCMHGAFPVLLIHFQGDDGTALIFAFMFAMMLFAAGVSWKYLTAAGIAAAAAVPVLWFSVMNTDQKMRFLAVFYPDAPEYQAHIWQQYQGEIAIGSGGIWGHGIMTGDHRYVPEIHNDFIFSFIGQALGFVGSVAVLALLCALCFKILHNARRCPDPMGQWICIGVFAMFTAQIAINIGMNLKIIPTIGVTLPFFSAGGTSVLTSYLAIGLVFSVYRYNTKGLFADNMHG